MPTISRTMRRSSNKPNFLKSIVSVRDINFIVVLDFLFVKGLVGERGIFWLDFY